MLMTHGTRELTLRAVLQCNLQNSCEKIRKHTRIMERERKKNGASKTQFVKVTRHDDTQSADITPEPDGCTRSCRVHKRKSEKYIANTNEHMRRRRNVDGTS